MMKKTFFIIIIFLIFSSCDYFGKPDGQGKAIYNDGIVTLSFDPQKSEDNLVRLLKDAKVSIDIALYGFSNEKICDALLDACERGLTVRCVTEYDSEHEDAWLRIAEAIRIHPEYNLTLKLGNTSGIMHNKYFIVDNKYVVTGSTNLTSGMWIHFNNLVIIRSSGLAADFQKDFEVLYAGYNATDKGNDDNLDSDNGFNVIYGNGVTWDENAHKIGEMTVQVYFTPYHYIFPSYAATYTHWNGPDDGDDTDGYQFYNYDDEVLETVDSISDLDEPNALYVIWNLLENAQKSITIYSFAFTDRVVMDLIIKAQEERDVKVKVWMERGQYFSSYSHHGKSFENFAQKVSDFKLCRKADGGLLHHKVIMIDDEILILGSLNFSSAAVNKNDENFLLIRNANKIIDSFKTEAARIDQYSHRPEID